ncbi:MAG: rod shape-determining protein [bacterium]|jgi:rod shape-determining protein MreB
MWKCDIGIDLGTANTLVYHKGRGIVLQEPSVVAINIDSGKILAVGEEAKMMIGRTPGNIIAVRPLKDGVIADFAVAKVMLQDFIRKTMAAIRYMKWVKPRVVVGIPSCITSVEKKAIIDAAIQAGAKEAFLIEEPLAAAIGAKMPIIEPIGNMVVDIGGGTTDVAIISLGGIVASNSTKIAGNEMDESITRFIKQKFNLLIGERTAENIKIAVGTALPLPDKITTPVAGRDLTTGLPKTIDFSSEEAYASLRDSVKQIADVVKQTVEYCPPEMVSDILERGIVLAGGVSLLRNMDSMLARETGVPVTVADNALTAVAEGTGIALEEIEIYSRVFKDKRFAG